MTFGSPCSTVFCLIYMSSCGVWTTVVEEANASQFSQRVDAVIGIAVLEIIEASYPSQQIVSLLTDFVTYFR